MITFNNPNNVNIKIRPLTIIAQIRIGKQIYKLVGYIIPSERDGVILSDPNAVISWGHIAGSGSGANLEFMW